MNLTCTSAQLSSISSSQSRPPAQRVLAAQPVRGSLLSDDGKIYLPTYTRARGKCSRYMYVYSVPVPVQVQLLGPLPSYICTC
jgi:hypothetical protein